MINYMKRLNAHLEDLNPILAGEAVCRPGERITPLHHTMLLHYVVAGKGVLYLDGDAYPVEQGQAFLLPVGAKACYEADREEPWHYRWISFSGVLAADFAQLPPVFSAPPDTLCHIENRSQPDPMLAYRLAGDLHLLYGQLVPPRQQPQDHVQRAVDYVETHYMHKLTVEEIAEFVGLNTSYLSKLFKQKTGHTLQNHILNLRLEESKRYLVLGYSVKEAAGACGFQDIANYSKLFKRENGRSPTQWLAWAKDER